MINQSIGLLGVAKQTAKGTAATQPTFKHGLTGGGLVRPTRSIEQENIACGVRASTSNGAYVSEVGVAVDFETMAYADVLGLYLAATLGNVVSAADPTSGTGYYKHTVTLGSELPWLTFFGQLGDTTEQTVQKASDCKMDNLTLDFEGNSPLKLGITAAGLNMALFGSWSGSVNPSCFDGYFIPTGGTFKLDTASSTPADVTIKSGTIELANNLDPKRGAGEVLPSELCEGKLGTSVKMVAIPEDWELLQKLITGSASGTTVASNIVYGSFSWEFTHSEDSKLKLKIEASNVPFNCEFPSVDPEGNAAEVEFSADNIGVASASGSPVTVTLINKTASY